MPESDHRIFPEESPQGMDLREEDAQAGFQRKANEEGARGGQAQVEQDASQDRGRGAPPLVVTAGSIVGVAARVVDNRRRIPLTSCGLLTNHGRLRLTA